MQSQSMTTKIRRKHGVIFWAKPSTLSVAFSILALVSLVFALIAAGVPIVPLVWYRHKPSTVQALERILKKPPVTFEDVLVEAGEKEIYQPPLDSSLSPENRLQIPAIGVNTQILEADFDQYETVLRQGVWRTPNFGTAYDRQLPMVLTAHRYGYLAWNNQYRRENSFYNLPKLAEGDKIIIDWGQRRYIYVIYGGEENEQVTDYTANLILYTCKFLESPIRIFKYARLVEQ